jgi:phage gp36-like protein
MVTVQTSPDGSSWANLVTVSATEPGRYDIVALGADRYVRAAWELTATDATFSISGTAHTVFAEQADIEATELRAEAIANVPAASIANALIKGSCDAEDALAASNALPLTSWPPSLSERVAAIAAFHIMKARGFRPQSFDELIVKAHDDAQRWLKDVAAGRIRPPGLAPATELGPKTSSGDPCDPTKILPRFSDNWGDFG